MYLTPYTPSSHSSAPTLAASRAPCACEGTGGKGAWGVLCATSDRCVFNPLRLYYCVYLTPLLYTIMCIKPPILLCATSDMYVFNPLHRCYCVYLTSLLYTIMCIKPPILLCATSDMYVFNPLHRCYCVYLNPLSLYNAFLNPFILYRVFNPPILCRCSSCSPRGPICPRKMSASSTSRSKCWRLYCA
jgi:hypothetical protein